MANTRIRGMVFKKKRPFHAHEVIEFFRELCALYPQWEQQYGSRLENFMKTQGIAGKPSYANGEMPHEQ